METRICSGTSSTAQPPQHDMISGGAGNLIGSNEDLLRTLLIHIPRKSLCKFKSVSKLWLSIISDPYFSLRWHKKHISYPSALSIYRHFGYEFIPLNGSREKKHPFGPNFGFDSYPLLHHSFHKIEILHSCNGLLLLGLKIKVNHKSYECRIGVYNSMTNQSKLIPKLPDMFSNFASYTKLAFDPLKSPNYKLVTVIVVPSQGSSLDEVLIYSSEKDSWKILPRRFKYSRNLVFEAGVYWNGAIHWPLENKSTYSLYFDVDKERCLRMPLPPCQGIEGRRNIRYFGESGGHLHLIDYKDDLALQFDVFEMEKDYSKWFVKYTVDLVMLRHGSIKRFIFLSLLVENNDGVEGGEEESLVMYVPGHKMVIAYNLKNGKSKKLCSLLLDRREMDNLKTKNWLKVHQIAY